MVAEDDNDLADDLWRLIDCKSDNFAELLEKVGLDKRRDLLGIDLSSINLDDTDFSGCDLRHTNFRGCSLRRASFREAVLRAANFKDADLLGAEFVGADIRDALFDKKDQTRIARERTKEERTRNEESGARGGRNFITGTVKWFNPTKGYGFIQPDGGGADAFVHISAIEKTGIDTLYEGQRVQYELIRGSSTVQAASVTVRKRA